MRFEVRPELISEFTTGWRGGGGLYKGDLGRCLALEPCSPAARGCVDERNSIDPPPA